MENKRTENYEENYLSSKLALDICLVGIRLRIKRITKEIGVGLSKWRRGRGTKCNRFFTASLPSENAPPPSSFAVVVVVGEVAPVVLVVVVVVPSAAAASIVVVVVVVVVVGGVVGFCAPVPTDLLTYLPTNPPTKYR
jgi:hypothetical protein